MWEADGMAIIGKVRCACRAGFVACLAIAGAAGCQKGQSGAFTTIGGTSQTYLAPIDAVTGFLE